MPKLLVVNADDLGMTEGTNNAIIECFRNGIVRSASIIAAGRAFENAVRLCKQNPSLSLGVHLTLVSEKPVLGAGRIPSLVDERGDLTFSNKEFVSRFMLRQIKMSEVMDELDAQIKKTLDAGISVSHLDSHQHLHMLPGVIDITIGLAKKYKIKRIRVPSEVTLSVKTMGLGLLSLFARKKMKEAGISCADHFWGIKKSGRINERDMLDLAERCQSGLTEVMCHPAYIDDAYRKAYVPYYKSTGFPHDPQGEVAALTSKSVRERLLMNHITLVGS